MKISDNDVPCLDFGTFPKFLIFGLIILRRLFKSFELVIFDEHLKKQSSRVYYYIR